MIPHIIHHIWFNFNDSSKDAKLPWKYRKQRNVLKKMNKEYTYMLWTESKAIAMVKKYYPQYYKAFTSLPEPIEKVDTFKYLVLHQFGGIYLDVDIVSRKPLKRFFRKMDQHYDIILSAENRYIIDKISISNASDERFLEVSLLS